MHGAPGCAAVCIAFVALRDRLRSSACGVALALLILGGANAAASAQAPAAPTTWAVRMAEGSRCKADSSFLQKLRAQIPEEQRASEGEAELVAEVTVEDKVAHIRVFDRVLAAEAGARELPLEARHCVDIADAVALVIGVLAEAGRGALSGDSAQPPPLPPAKQEPTPPPPPPPPPKKSERPARPVYRRVRPVWRGPPAGHDLAAAVGLQFGLVDQPVLTYTLAWGIRPTKTWPIWLQASGWTGAEGADDRATLHSVHGGVFVCPFANSYGRVRLRACAGFQAGAVFASSRNLQYTSSDTRPLALAGIELAAHVRIVGPLEFLLLARGDALLMRSRFYYRDDEGMKRFLYDPSVVVGGPFAGFALKLR